MADQNRVTTLDGLSLPLHSEVWIESVDNPDAGECALCVHRGLIKARNGRVNVLVLGRRAEDQWLAEGIWVGLNADFLSIAHDIVRAEDVHVLDTHNAENGAIDGAKALSGGGRAHVALLWAWALVIRVKSKESVCLLASEHQTVSRSDQSIGRVGPRYLLVGSFVHCTCLAEGQLASSLLGLELSLPATKVLDLLSLS